MEFAARRGWHYAFDPNARLDGLGWMRRLLRAFQRAVSLI